MSKEIELFYETLNKTHLVIIISETCTEIELNTSGRLKISLQIFVIKPIGREHKIVRWEGVDLSGLIILSQSADRWKDKSPIRIIHF